jgi:4-hydroxybenzoate polyprenyltransferase
MIGKIISDIEKQHISVGQWLVGFTGIVFIRFILEVISSPISSGLIPSDADTLIQYWLSFLAIILGIMCITRYFTKGDAGIAKIALYGLPIIWLGPIVDIITSLGKGHTITYIFNGPEELLFNFITFFGPQVTVGLRFELFIVIFAVGLYVWNVRKNVRATISAILLSYLFLFFIFAIPSIIYGLQNVSSLTDLVTTSYVANFLSTSISQSNISHNTIDTSLLYKSGMRAFELGFDKLLSQISFILAFIWGMVWFWQTKKEKFIAVIKNSRPERVAFYLTLLTLGIGYAYFSGYGKINSWIDWLSILTLLISWYGAWMFAVHTNDVADISIDKISNPNRPITGETVTLEEMSGSAYIWLMISLLGSWSAGYYPFFMNLVFTASYYIYSVPPLRFKRIPIVSSFLISIACLSSVLAGFFFLSADKTFHLFPPLLVIGIIVMFTLGVNIRDMKDIEGDKEEGILTLPVIFGNYGKKVVGGMLALSFMLAPIFLSFYTLYIIAIPTAYVGYKLVTKKQYNDRHIFYLFFVFVASSVALVGVLYWFANQFLL